MSGRYGARPTDSGWGVWHSQVNSWKTALNLDEQAARSVASLMDQDADREAAQRAEEDRPVYHTNGCPRPVHVYRETLYGREWYARRTLIAWVRTHNRWMGDVRAPDGSTKWEPPELLEPARQLGPYD